ncbi:MAG: N-acetylmuramoyl-L-alanine amidase-like domain-containing protein, partial [Bacteroidota bacterium]
MSIGQTVCSVESKARLNQALADLGTKDVSDVSIDKLIQDIGRSFLGTTYVEKTLEVEGDEPLVINLIGLDCTTYLESIVSLTRLAKKGELSEAAYEKELEFLRYRDGKRAHYPSRLHYFSDWIYENEQKGILKNITQEIGGIPYENQLGFMSAHPQYYPQLTNASYVQALADVEAEVRQRDYHYIPKASVQKLEKGIQPGDLIAITISMKSLDISHVGLAVEKDGRIHLMH